MNEITIVPSLPASSLEELIELAENLQGDISELQIDIVDGQFVPSLSWPFTEADPSAALGELVALPEDLLLEIDCMVEDPEQYFPAFSGLPVVRVVIHYGSTGKYEEVLELGAASGYKMGLAIKNDDIDNEEAVSLIDKFDYVQVMGIREVGQQGQAFDERTLTSVSSLRSLYPDMEIAVDGSVNQDTIAELVEAGATRLAPGSAVAKAADSRSALRELAGLVGVPILDKSPTD